MQTLKDINPDVQFESYCHDITTTENFEHMLDRMSDSPDPPSAIVSVILSCLVPSKD